MVEVVFELGLELLQAAYEHLDKKLLKDRERAPQSGDEKEGYPRSLRGHHREKDVLPGTGEETPLTLGRGPGSFD